MAILIPALNARTEQEFVARARLLMDWHVPWVQIDVSDGIVGMPKNFASPSLTRAELLGVRLDIHLMVASAGAAVTIWEVIQPARLTIHLEAAPHPGPLLRRIAGAGIERGLALAPETPLSRARPYFGEVDLLLFVAVPPGKSGQPFDPRTLDRVREARAEAPALNIGVDGGVTADHIPHLRAAGATTIYAASAIFNAPNPRTAYETLRRRVEPAVVR